MEVIKRAEAKIRNQINYYTGKLCKNGHLDRRATLTGVCLSCNKEAHKRWYSKNKKDKTWSIIRHIKNVRNRAIRSGTEFNIEYTDLEWPDICPVLGIPIYYTSNTSRWNTPSLDRIDSNLGYIKGNVVVVSMRANSLKCDIQPDEVDLMYSYLKTLNHYKDSLKFQ